MPPYSKNKKEPSSHTETMVRGSTLLGTNAVPTHRITARHRTNLPIIGMSAHECISSTYP